MKKLLIILAFVLWAVPIFAQVDTAWVRRYNGAGKGSQAMDEYLWVPNFHDNTVSKVNVNTHTIVATVPVGTNPTGVAVSIDYVYVTCRRFVFRISRTTSAVFDSIDFSGLTDFPVGVAVDRFGYAYVVGPVIFDFPWLIQAFLAKVNPGGTIDSSTYLTRVDPGDVSVIGVGLNTKGDGFIPWRQAWYCETGVFHFKTDKLSLTNYPISYLFYRGPGVGIDEDGNGWTAGCREDQANLTKLEPTGALTHYSVPAGWNNRLGDVVVDTQGSVWASTGIGLLKLVPKTGEVYHYDVGVAGGGLACDIHGYIWATFPDSNKIKKFDLSGTQVGSSVQVGSFPLGYGDMTGYECMSPWHAPIILSLCPQSSTIVDRVYVTIFGSNCRTGASVKLTRSGQPADTIPASEVTFHADTTIIARFDLSGQPIGSIWDLIVSNPNGAADTLFSAFRIVSPSELSTKDVLCVLSSNHERIQDFQANAKARSKFNGEPLDSIIHSVSLYKSPDKVKNIDYANDDTTQVISSVINRGWLQYEIDPDSGYAYETNLLQVAQMTPSEFAGLNFYDPDIFLFHHYVTVKEIHQYPDSLIFVLEAIPKRAEWTYSKLELEIDYNRGLVVKSTVYSDTVGQQTVTVTEEQLIDGIWVGMKSINTITDTSETLMTEIQLSNIQFNIGIPDSVFYLTKIKQSKVVEPETT